MGTFFNLKNMKRNILFALIALLLITGFSCKKFAEFENPGQSLPNTHKEPTKVLLTKKWKLSKVSNLNDPSKYINTLLDLKSDNTYIIAGSPMPNNGQWNSGTTMNSGASELVLMLSDGLFSKGDPVNYTITLLTETQLTFTEYYSKDGKDVFIEYHYVAVR
jgi:hypothetical protein